MILELWPADNPRNLIVWDGDKKSHFLVIRNSPREVEFNLNLIGLTHTISKPTYVDYGTGPIITHTATRITN